jgi:putative intracellular protease/amidase
LATDSTSIALIESFANAKKPVGAVCHAPAVLVNVKAADGSPLVKGRKVTGFTNEEEGMVGLTDVVPFLLQDKLAELGGKYESGSAWGVHVAVDGLLITGQNPASSEAVADELVKLLKK